MNDHWTRFHRHEPRWFFIARQNGDIDWLLEHDQAGEDHGYNDFIRDIDVIVMGRGTYEAVRRMGEWFYTRPVLVLSEQLAPQEVPQELSGKVRFSDKSPGSAMAMLASEGARRAYVDGGRVIQSFLELDMISDMVITTVPILLGAGRPLLVGVIAMWPFHTRAQSPFLLDWSSLITKS